MGYRLNILDQKKNDITIYHTKLFGYTNHDEELRSYKYLLSLGKLHHVAYFGYGADNKIKLTKNQFDKFIHRYVFDYVCEEGELNQFICDMLNDAEKAIENGENKYFTIYWGA